MPLMPATIFLQGERGGRKTQRKGRGSKSPSLRVFVMMILPFLPNFTLTPKNCSQAKCRASAPLKSLDFQFGCCNQEFKEPALWLMAKVPCHPGDLPEERERRKRWHLPVKVIVVIFRFTPHVQKDQRKAESSNKQWEKHAFPLERERKEKRSEPYLPQSNHSKWQILSDCP